MELKVNREYFLRHLGVAVLMLALSCWFAWDGYYGYPEQSAEQLYAALHQGEAAPDKATAIKVKDNAVHRQKEFMVLALLASLAVGLNLLLATRLKFSFDDTGFVCNGKRLRYDEITSIDRKRWAKKGILVLMTPVGRVVLDAWHYKGVDEFEKHLSKEG